MTTRFRLHLQTNRRRGLTLIPVLACIVLLSIFLGMLAQRQVRGHNAARVAHRKAVARMVLLGERDRLLALKKAGKTIAAGRRVLTRAENPAAQEPVAIVTEAARAPGTGFDITVQIPADAATNFVREALNVP